MDLSVLKTALVLIEEPRLRDILEHILDNQDITECGEVFGVYPEGATFKDLVGIKFALNQKIPGTDLFMAIANLIDNNPKHATVKLE